jgi:hypothetical protein
MAKDGSTEGPAPGTSPADIVRVDQALWSMRDSGFDLSTAAGEVVDNSQQAGATIVRIRTVEDVVPIEGKAKPVRAITQIAFADNGIGISKNELANCLTLGYSTRYNDRTGLGRYGVGMKLAAISQATRVDVFTRTLGDRQIYRAFLDLELVQDGAQDTIIATPVEDFPAEFRDLMKRPGKGSEFDSGTLVVWSNVDRHVEGGRYGSSLDERLKAMTRFLARAYRRFIDQGLYLELNGREVTLYDPLFLLENPRAREAFGEDLRAEVIDATKPGDIVIDGHSVGVTVTLYPERLRRVRLQGGLPERAGPEFKVLHIPDNQGRVTILRNGREIYYDLIPRLFPSGVQDSDRFIGVEVSFPAELDEYFQVRHVKRGAEPVSKLREEIRNFVHKPIVAAREKIQKTWDATAQQQRQTSGEHSTAEAAVKRSDLTAPRGKAGAELSKDEQNRKVNELLEDLGIDPKESPQRAEEIKQKLEELPFMLVDGSWPGKELMEITHLNGRAVVRLNHRHAFFREVYDPVKEMAAKSADLVELASAVRLVKRMDVALDVLLMAYAKAENMDPDPNKYDDLRSDWGKFLQAYMREALADL